MTATKHIPWSKDEDLVVITRYTKLNSRGLMPYLPGRTFAAIQARAKTLGIAQERPQRIQDATHDGMKIEKDLIVEALEWFIPTICRDKQKVRKALLLLEHLKSNSLQWWWNQRHLNLGLWAEQLINDYEYKPVPLDRDEFLDGDGVFYQSEAVEL